MIYIDNETISHASLQNIIGLLRLKAINSLVTHYYTAEVQNYRYKVKCTTDKYNTYGQDKLQQNIIVYTKLVKTSQHRVFLGILRKLTNSKWICLPQFVLNSKGAFSLVD